MNETQRRRRGHAFMPPKAVLRRIPKLYGTDGTPAEDKMIYVHYFGAAGDWYIAELDPEESEAYGYVRLDAHPDGAEWGYIPLDELEEATYGLYFAGRRVRMAAVERDLHWSPVKFGDIKKIN